MDACASGRLDVPALLTHRVPLAELPRAFGSLEQRPAGFLKAWVAL